MGSRILCGALLVVFVLGGCVVPGSSLDTVGKETVRQADDRFDLDRVAAIYPITPRLLAELNRSKGDHVGGNAGADLGASSYQYRVSVGDVLNVVVWEHPELMAPTIAGAGTAQSNYNPGRGGVWVDERGNIFYPYVGNLHVAGKTLPQIRTLLRDRLARYIKNPQLDVNISSFRSQKIYVNGAVKNAAQYPITDVPMTVLDAVNLAGGFTDDADTRRIQWTQRGVDRSVSLQELLSSGARGQHYLLSAGDTVYVPSDKLSLVYVMGEVGKQSTLKIGAAGMNLTRALSDAEGMNQNLANATGVFVIRMNKAMEDGKYIHIYQLNLGDATAYAMGTQFPLRSDDVVYVTATPLTRWNRVLAQILPSLSAIGVSGSAAESLRNLKVYQ